MKENIILQSLSEKIVGTCFWPSSDARVPVVIMCHGAGDFKENFFPIAQYIAEHGIAVLCLDMHGHGKSEGARFNVVIDEWVADITSAIDFLEKHPKADSHRIGAFGLSSGGTAILEVAAVDRRICSVVALDATVRNSVPFFNACLLKSLIMCGKVKKFFTGTDLHVPMARLSGGIHLAADPVLDAEIQARPEFQEVFNNFPFPGGTQAFFVDTIKRVGAIVAPTMVIWGEDDKTDSFETAKLLYAALNCKKELNIIAGNGHVGHLDRHKDQVYALALRWFKETL